MTLPLDKITMKDRNNLFGIKNSFQSGASASVSMSLAHLKETRP